MRTYLTAEISASAVEHNLRLLRGLLPAGTRMCGVVKADCYGHGLGLLLGTIARHVQHLAVAAPCEALDVRRLGCTLPLLTFMSPCALGCGRELDDSLDELVAADVTLTLVSADEAVAISAAAGRVGKPASVHLKLDTGMGRSGAPAGAAGSLARDIAGHPLLRLTGMYSHFATADDADKTYALEQLARMKRAAGAVANGNGGPLVHIANSAATIDIGGSHLDMVRPGIAMYGYQPSDSMVNRLPLRPAMRLVGRLLQVKTLPGGSRCGYGLTHEFDRDTPVGLVSIGYNDGYLRCLSSRASMGIRGREAPVCGRVSMDQTIVDLSHVPGAAVGDEVEIVSPEAASPHSAENLARLAGTIPYEITCRMGSGGRVGRVLAK